METSTQIEYKVCVICMTYNQENFISDALEGFVHQQTDFPYCVIVVDDASKDRTADIVRQYEKLYPNIIKGVYLAQNHFSQKKSKMPYVTPWRMRSMYLAWCEGDDYWIDRHKLQKQVDFLEAHPDFTLVFHNALIRYQDSDKPDCLMKSFQTGTFSTSQLVELWQLPFASFLYHSYVEDSNIYKKLAEVWPGGYARLLAASILGKVFGISECMSVYRKNEGGVSNTMSPAKCLQIDYSLATATGDAEAVKAMDGRAEQILNWQMRGIIKGEPKAKDVWQTALSFNRWVPYKALMLFIVKWPIRKVRGLKHKLMNKWNRI